MFPNPTNGNISIKSNVSINKIEIYDVFGKLIQSKAHSNNLTLEQFATGIYFLKIYSNNYIGTKKIIKN